MEPDRDCQQQALTWNHLKRLLPDVPSLDVLGMFDSLNQISILAGKSPRNVKCVEQITDCCIAHDHFPDDRPEQDEAE